MMISLKKLAAAVMMTVALIAGSAHSAQAGSPVRFGVKAGVQMNKLKFNEDGFASSNRGGFTGGLMMQFVAPIIGIGMDASLMYTHRQNRIYYEEAKAMNVNSDYIEIPLNLRWNINIPVVGKIVTPFLTTGPDFSFLLSKKNVKNAWRHRTFDFAWNFGFGLKLVNKIELAASYGLGISNAASGSDMSLYGPARTDGKNRFWTVTAAYLF